MFLSRPDQDDQPSLQSEHAEPDISNLAAPQGPEGQAAVPAGGGEAWPGDQWAAVDGSGRPMLQTSSNQRDSHHHARTSVTNVVNLSQKTTVFAEKPSD